VTGDRGCERAKGNGERLGSSRVMSPTADPLGIA
jgi:hypothetical protein